MKKKLIFATALALCVLMGCNNETDGNIPEVDDGSEVAYISIQVEKQNRSLLRSSSEDDGLPAESELKVLYVISFDDSRIVKQIPGTTDYYIIIPGSASVPYEAFKISGKVKEMLLIANPGPKLRAAITNISSGSTYMSVNAAITAANKSDLIDNAVNTQGFAMISSGDDTGLTPLQKILNPLVDITGHIETVSTHGSDAAAKAAAEGNRAIMKIERLASKVDLTVGSPLELKQPNASFTLINWVLDGLNTTYFPFAEKTILSVFHNPTWYESSFYTQDPNYVVGIPIGSGLEYTTIDRTGDYSPILVPGHQWMSQGGANPDYCIENTMHEDEQKYGNATRLILKATYYPDNTWTGDWFSFAGINYETLTLLKTAYDEGGTNLVAACNDMFDKIKAYADAASPAITLDGTDFSSLTQEDLDKIPNGGEVIKNGIQPVIRWYQDGLCYYRYENIHDNATTVENGYAKYGFVRNSWYKLTLGSVSGPGSPWYPDINNPGPGDPDKPDPIDEESGYIGITVSRAPWILWENTIEI